jgi:DNA-binding NarL/FixJ family response regulator
MPGMNGVETASRLVAAHPTSIVVLVSSEDHASLPGGADCCGAAALLCKEEFGTGALRQLWPSMATASLRLIYSDHPIRMMLGRARAAIVARDPSKAKGGAWPSQE